MVRGIDDDDETYPRNLSHINLTILHRHKSKDYSEAANVSRTISLSTLHTLENKKIRKKKSKTERKKKNEIHHIHLIIILVYPYILAMVIYSANNFISFFFFCHLWLVDLSGYPIKMYKNDKRLPVFQDKNKKQHLELKIKKGQNILKHFSFLKTLNNW